MIGLVLLAAVLGESPADAESAYRAGLAARDDAEVAQPHFAESARLYERLWREEGIDTPALHRNRAQAYLLASDLPNALRAYREGLGRWPDDPQLQAGLEAARAEVAYPREGSLREWATPHDPWHPTDWLTLGQLRLLAIGFYVFGWFGVIRWRMTRRSDWWMLVLSAWLVTGLAVAGLCWEDREAVAGAIIARSGTELRQGNARSYPLRLEDRLPAGVEVQIRHRRGGWVQVELSSGIVGWVPESAVILIRSVPL